MAGAGGMWLMRLMPTLANGFALCRGISTALATLLPFEHPTAMPYFEVGSKWLPSGWFHECDFASEGE